MMISDEDGENVDSRSATRKLSPILKGYLRAGAMICGAPAYDAEFGTADVLAILEMEKMAKRYKQHYAVGGA
jgi:putative hemolysin